MMLANTVAELDYAAPRTLAEALDLAARPGAALLAGGTDLLGQIKDEAAAPSLLVDLTRIPELQGIVRGGDGALRLGAAVTIHQLLRDATAAEGWPLLRQAAEVLAVPQLRSAATVGGNLCQRPRCWYFRNPRFACFKKGGVTCFAREAGGEPADGAPCVAPSPSDLAAALLACDARVEVAGPAGSRTVPLGEFVLDTGDDAAREVDLGPGEIVMAVHVPLFPGGAAYVKEWDYDSWGFASANVAAIVAVEGVHVREARIAVGGLSVAPFRAASAERWLAGRTLDEDAARYAADLALERVEPPTIHRYRLPIARAAIVRALLTAAPAISPSPPTPGSPETQ
jgi:xanthine dehydrogenase YagS FAD-binding subunit